MNNTLYRQTFIAILIMLQCVHLSAQNSGYRINYQAVSNGNYNEGKEIQASVLNDILLLAGSSEYENNYIDYKRQECVQMLTTQNTLYKLVTKFDELPQPVLSNDTCTVLNILCKKATFSYFSNTIDVWYTHNDELKGAPLFRYIPFPDCLVLRVLINGNYEIIAKSIDKDPETNFTYDYLTARTVTEPQYSEILIESRYTRIPIFKREQINFDPDLVPGTAGVTKECKRYSKGTVILSKVAVSESNKGGYYFLKLTNRSNGDAYDRTGTVFILDEHSPGSMYDALKNGIKVLPELKDSSGELYQGIISTDNYDPPVELMRFFTSFGAGNYNSKRVINNYNWSDSVVYKQDITTLIPDDRDSIMIGVFIGNYDKGGHIVDLELNHYPAFGEEDERTNWIKPLFNTVNIMEMSGQNYSKIFKTEDLRIDFFLPDNVDDLQLLFTTTGHGGWDTGDEFMQRENRIVLNGNEIFRHVPWRSDCATYRMLNPASGNFKNGLSSSDLSRSNWCPATLTPPFVIPLKNLTPGKHSIQISIDQGQDEGTSFNAWNVSGILIGKITKVN